MLIREQQEPCVGPSEVRVAGLASQQEGGGSWLPRRCFQNLPQMTVATSTHQDFWGHTPKVSPSPPSRMWGPPRSAHVGARAGSEDTGFVRPLPAVLADPGPPRHASRSPVQPGRLLPVDTPAKSAGRSSQAHGPQASVNTQGRGQGDTSEQPRGPGLLTRPQRHPALAPPLTHNR